MRQGGALGVFHVLQQATCGTQPAWSIFHAKANQIAGTELQVQLLARGINFKFPQRATAQSATAFNQRHFGEVFGVEQFCRVGALQFGSHRFAVSRLTQAKTPGADVQRGVAKPFAVLPQRCQQVILALLKQGFITDGAWRDDAYDFTLNRAFRGCRIADLFADGNGLTLIHQLGQIVFNRVVRDTGHRDGLACGCATFG